MIGRDVTITWLGSGGRMRTELIKDGDEMMECDLMMN